MPVESPDDLPGAFPEAGAQLLAQTGEVESRGLGPARAERLEDRLVDRPDAPMLPIAGLVVVVRGWEVVLLPGPEPQGAEETGEHGGPGAVHAEDDDLGGRGDRRGRP